MDINNPVSVLANAISRSKFLVNHPGWNSDFCNWIEAEHMISRYRIAADKYQNEKRQSIIYHIQKLQNELKQLPATMEDK